MRAMASCHLYQPLQKSRFEQLSGIAHSNLFHHRSAMRIDRFDADPQAVSDLAAS